MLIQDARFEMTYIASFSFYIIALKEDCCRRAHPSSNGIRRSANTSESLEGNPIRKVACSRKYDSKIILGSDYHRLYDWCGENNGAFSQVNTIVLVVKPVGTTCRIRRKLCNRIFFLIILRVSRHRAHYICYHSDKEKPEMPNLPSIQKCTHIEPREIVV